MTTVQERFDAKWIAEPTTGCWLWIASLRNKGYGAFCYPNATTGTNHGRAHRYAYEMAYGAIPPGLCVLHQCDTPSCVNPTHLFVGTKDDNNQDMRRKGRHVPGGTHTEKSQAQYKRGEAHHAAKLDTMLVQSMRNDYASGKYSYSQLAAKYAVALGHCWRIVQRKVWAHVAEANAHRERLWCSPQCQPVAQQLALFGEEEP